MKRWLPFALMLSGCVMLPLAAPRVPAVHTDAAAPPADSRYRDYRGVIHVHTAYSDGTGTYATIGRIAARQGLDFLLVTDHNTLQPLRDGKEGWYPSATASPRTLVLAGEEVSAPDGHVLALGVTEPVNRGQSSQAMIEAITRQGGLAFLAHPHYGRRPWTNWAVSGYTGLELYNTVEDAGADRWARLALVGLLAAPDDFYRSLIRRPSETLARWDALLARGGRLTGIGAVDAHGLRMAPYRMLFQTVRTHLLMPELSKAAILEALRAGHAYFALELSGDAAGFVFRAEAGGATAGIMGDAVALRSGLTLLIFTPATAQVRLFKDGAPVEERRAQTWRYPVAAPGVYRVEAELHGRFWIASNPIYVRAAGASVP